ncbi:MAG: endonuclease/exonuclease/phosphatase family protein, partial [Candidatus Acidiferrales bacterium]
MAHPGLKFSGGKLAPRSDLRVGADSGAPLCGISSTTTVSDNQPGPSNNKQAGNKVVTPVVTNGPKNGNFIVDFCNIRGLNSNINSVHQHLQTNKPHLLALCETKVSSSTSIVNYLYPGYELHSRFRRNFGVCLFARSDLSCQREEALEPKDFDVMWFKITTLQTTRFICCLYRPPSDKQFRALFSSLANTIDFLQINHPNAEIAILGDFNVHNTNWLKYSNTNVDQGREAESFAISCGLTQLLDEPTRIPDRDGEFASLLDLFLTTNPEIYTVTVNPPLGSSDHKL